MYAKMDDLSGGSELQGNDKSQRLSVGDAQLTQQQSAAELAAADSLGVALELALPQTVLPTVSLREPSQSLRASSLPSSMPRDLHSPSLQELSQPSPFARLSVPSPPPGGSTGIGGLPAESSGDLQIDVLQRILSTDSVGSTSDGGPLPSPLHSCSSVAARIVGRRMSSTPSASPASVRGTGCMQGGAPTGVSTGLLAPSTRAPPEQRRPPNADRSTSFHLGV